ncbi:MAG: N(G),N(G)-dimethylarginine dimethylaminohydrolase [Acidobacteria bacterium]|nr:N(G),N(G)-dimethylarginine dimethylaminohydrolase [Acidobacteriota bacterium]
MFQKAIVRTPGQSMVQGITTAELGIPDYDLALEQHRSYVYALEACGLNVTILPADEHYPDSTFVEDTAIVTRHGAIITRPGAESRKGETTSIKTILASCFDVVAEIHSGSLDGGDVMMVGDHFFVGLSDRTNAEGATALIDILNQWGMTGSTVNLNTMLHLKTGIVYLERNHVLATGEFLAKPEFVPFSVLPVDEDEAYAANSIWINDKVMTPAGYPKTRALIEKAGYEAIEVEMSEFRKLDGGLSCLSLRF